MPKYKLPDGSIVEVPEDATPEEMGWLQAQKATPVKEPSVGMDVVRSLGSGAIEGAIRAPLIAADLGHFAKIGLNKLFPDHVGPAEATSYSDDLLNILRDDAGLKLPMPETRAGRYANAVGNGVGGLVLGGSGAFRGPVAMEAASGIKSTAKALAKRLGMSPVVQAGGVGAAGEFAGDVSRGFAETQQQNPLARFAGSTGAALAVALQSTLGKAPAARPLHEVLKPSNPEAFRGARAQNTRLTNAGATQNTVGDSFHGINPQVAALEREVSNELGGGALGAKLTGRQTGDLPALAEASRQQIQNTVVPNRMPASATNPSSDLNVLAQARSNRSDARQRILQSADLVPRADVASVVRALRQRQLSPENRGTVDGRAAALAARAVSDTPMYPMGAAPGAPAMPRTSGPTPVTPLGPEAGPGPMPGMPMTPPALQGGPGGPRALPPPGGTALTPMGPSGAVGAPILDPADFGMGPKPMSGFQMPGVPDITDLVQRPPQVPRGANLVALSKIVKGLDTVSPKTQGPAAGVLSAGATTAASRTADRALREVSPEYDWAMTNHASMSPGVEALQTIVDSPGVLRGTPSTLPNQTREALAAHLAGVDLRNAQLGRPATLGQDVGERLYAGDVMASNTSQHGIQGLQQELGQSGGAAVIAPWQAALRAMTTRSRRKANEQISNLLANPTPENYRILEKLSRENPDIARALTRQGLIGAVNANTQTEGSAP